jgi:cysteine desulfurase family protein (TIGR01976 family)
VNRERFPQIDGGWARLDGPAGTQMVDAAIDAMTDFMRSGDNANHGGMFAAARATDEIVESARRSVGALLGGAFEGVAFGPSMTALTMRFASAVKPSRVVCTRLDHDANVAPWLLCCPDVVFAQPDGTTLELPAAALETVLTDDTEWVAVTAASNACGSVPELRGIIDLAHQAGAKVFVDAVHAAPHRPIDVAELDCDALACSAYKWFGPHVGILWARPEILEELRPAKLRPSPDTVPERFELGTLPFESLAGVAAAADYTASVGWERVREHEDALLKMALDGLAEIPDVTLYGAAPDRTPTIMFNVRGRTSEDVASALAQRKVAVWHGNYYAKELEHFLGLEPHGAVRAGFVHYNDESDAQRLIDGVRELSRRG